jgi:hypothetical protein
MQLRRRLSVFEDTAAQSEGNAVEHPPGIPLVEVGERGPLPLLDDIGDALKVDDRLPVQVEDDVIRLLVCEHRRLVSLESPRLGFSDLRQRLDDFHQEPWELSFGICRVLPADYVIPDEAEITAYEALRAEADANRKFFVMAIPQTACVGITRVGTAERHEPKIALALVIDGMVLLDDIMSEHRKCRPSKIDKAKVFDRDMGRCSRRSCHLPKHLVGNKFPTRMEIEHFKELLCFGSLIILP